MKQIALVGATGSIGRQTLQVARERGYRVVALAAGRDKEQLKQQIAAFQPEAAALFDEAAGRELRPVGSCLSDLSVILKYGSDEAVGFGAGREFGVYGGAHQPDEFIECDKLVEYAKIIGAYILRTVG